MMKPLLLVGIILGLHGHAQTNSQLPFSDIFQPGEIVSYEISYNWGFIWVDAGVVEFKVLPNSKENQFSFSGIGRTYPRWDWIYKVRDEYRSSTIANPQLDLVWFERKVREGSTFIHNEYTRLPGGDSLTYKSFNKKGKGVTNKLKTESGVNDVLSMIYKARTYNFDLYKEGNSIPIKLILDGQIHDSHIRYLGKEEIDSELLGEISCYKFKPLLIEGTIFNAGEDMTVWVTADKNRIPVLIETPILVGNINAILKRIEGEVHPYTSKD